MKIDFLDMVTYPLKSSESGWFAERPSSKSDANGSKRLAGDTLADTMAHKAQCRNIGARKKMKQ